MKPSEIDDLILSLIKDQLEAVGYTAPRGSSSFDDQAYFIKEYCKYSPSNRNWDITPIGALYNHSDAYVKIVAEVSLYHETLTTNLKKN